MHDISLFALNLLQYFAVMYNKTCCSFLIFSNYIFAAVIRFFLFQISYIFSVLSSNQMFCFKIIKSLFGLSKVIKIQEFFTQRLRMDKANFALVTVFNVLAIRLIFSSSASKTKPKELNKGKQQEVNINLNLDCFIYQLDYR